MIGIIPFGNKCILWNMMRVVCLALFSLLHWHIHSAVDHWIVIYGLECHWSMRHLVFLSKVVKLLGCVWRLKIVFFFFFLFQFGCCQESLTRVLQHLFNWELSCRLWQCCENYLLLDEFLLGSKFLICPESLAMFWAEICFLFFFLVNFCRGLRVIQAPT